MDLEHLLWAAVQAGDWEALERLSHRDVDWNKPNPGDSMTPLLAALARAVSFGADKTHFNIMEWLVKQGADPTYRFPAGSPLPLIKLRMITGQEKEHSLSGKSVLDILALLGYVGMIQRLTLAALKATPQRHQVRVDKGVVDLWERILGSTSSHDVSFQTAGGPVTAHSLVLQEASPVLKAMLGSSMKEGETGQIEVRDASSSAVRLVLEILYTCSSSSFESSCEDTLAALDLAHRWQIGVVATQTKLKNGCPRALQELFYATEPPAVQSEKRRRRF
eukprot:Skav213461  [mRNA]  locus=scaffold3211:25456:27240:- [translate_table: standard]